MANAFTVTICCCRHKNFYFCDYQWLLSNNLVDFCSWYCRKHQTKRTETKMHFDIYENVDCTIAYTWAFHYCSCLSWISILLKMDVSPKKRRNKKKPIFPIFTYSFAVSKNLFLSHFCVHHICFIDCCWHFKLSDAKYKLTYLGLIKAVAPAKAVTVISKKKTKTKKAEKRIKKKKKKKILRN